MRTSVGQGDLLTRKVLHDFFNKNSKVGMKNFHKNTNMAMKQSWTKFWIAHVNSIELWDGHLNLIIYLNPSMY